MTMYCDVIYNNNIYIKKMKEKSSRLSGSKFSAFAFLKGFIPTIIIYIYIVEQIKQESINICSTGMFIKLCRLRARLYMYTLTPWELGLQNSQLQNMTRLSKFDHTIFYIMKFGGLGTNWEHILMP